MTPEIAYVLILFFVALFCFATELLAVDVVGLLVLLALVVPSVFGLQILTPSQALGAFGDETVMLLIADFMLTTGLIRTGITAEIGNRIYTIGSKRPWTVIPLLLGVAAAISFWISNTVTMAVFFRSPSASRNE
ncbi:MAG: hypothetical protein IPF82_14545 [Blastocatellia bacterium]|nr:hypothetical protein [Blastocatellia bacterium]